MRVLIIEPAPPYQVRLQVLALLHPELHAPPHCHAGRVVPAHSVGAHIKFGSKSLETERRWRGYTEPGFSRNPAS